MQKLILLVLLMVCCCAIRINGQTFQYSRGWTNGKRSNVNSEIPPIRQMMQSPQIVTPNDLNNRERLIQHIIKNPCDLRMALLANHNIGNLKFLNDDYTPSAAANVDTIDDDAINRFKRELLSN